MPIKLRQEGSLWLAEVTPPHGSWQSPRPMVVGDLTEALESIGCRRDDIDLALREAYLIKRERDWNEKVLPKLRQALAGTYDVPPQDPSEEGIIAYVLFERESRLTLWEISDAYDYLNRAGMTADILAWAFVRMNARGWLDEHGSLFGLTVGGRKAIMGIVGAGSIQEKMDRLVEWTRTNPSTKDVRT